ncbi:MAG: ABC transporter permease [Tissierellia bacterium]|nr:ABC transporter permease [Tissierellia bacterium]
MKKIKRLAYPYNIWMLLLIVAPLILVAYYAFTNPSGDFTLENFSKIFEANTLKTLYNSISIAFVSTVICLIIGYPMAYFISKTDAKYRTVAMMLIMVPMWMNFLLRTYAWVTILSPSGVLNSVLKLMGLKGIDIMYTQSAVTIGMVYNFLPFMILPIYTALEKMDYRLVEAAHDLGANDFQAFSKVIFPMSLPGVFSGISMVFVPAISTFEITRLLGGGKVNMIGNVVEQQFLYTGNWNYGSALALILMVFIVISILFDKEGVETGGKNE